MAEFNESEYVELFLAEARENLETLNTAVVRLESDPADQSTVDSIFRVAHSVKGMAATMGFDAVAQLTHAMEDVFSLLRNRSTGLSTEAIDVLFDCLDMLATMVSEIEAGGATTTDPEPLIGRLKGLTRGGNTEAEAKAAAAAAAAKAIADAAEEKAALAGASPETTAATPAAAEPPKSEPPPAAEAELAPAAQDGPATGAPPAERRADPAPELPPDKPVPDIVETAVREAHTRATVRVEASRLDTLLHMIGELVVRRSSVEQLAEATGQTELQSAVGELTRASQAVQDMVMRIRMVPIDTAFARLPRLVRDLSNQLGKKVDLQLEGRDTELDRTAVEALVEPLMHLVRNAIDHGIEEPEERKAAGKAEMGVLRIAARHEGGEVVIGITDDGAGIDHNAIVAKAVERGLISPDQVDRIDPDQAIEFLFMSGFSTAVVVSDVSGRGVGMDAVRSAVRGFGGDVRVRSTLGTGTTTELRMPLTLAILPALVVSSAGDPYAIQLDRVDRTFKLDEVSIKSVAGQPVAVFPDGAMPVVSLAEMFDRKNDDLSEPRFMVTIRSADRQLALLVDDMIGRRELVTRPVPERVRKDSPVSGGAVLASG
ncbi:MAG TPA: chemotaxis protein CheA, partial [Solirubrobacterales bacterium]|nr:chemotaxis protein CheA [Solirubrobacterales bacterium]